MIQAILFDFDGLILDTETPIFSAWQTIYAEFACSLSLDEYSGCIGASHTAFDPCADLERKCGRPVAREEMQPRAAKLYRELITEKDALPGIREVLAAARQLGIRTAVASNSTREWVEEHLTRLELLPFFNVIRTRDDVARLKPDPELYLEALAALGVKAEQAFALEDSPHGILAARRAGLFAVAVPNELTRALPLNEPDLCLDSLGELPLPALLERVQEQKSLSG